MVPEEAVVLAGETHYGLHNLAQMCRERERVACLATSGEHFTRMRRVAD